MPKARQQTTPTAKQLSRHQRMQRQRRVVQLSTVAVLALVLGILGYGYWKINVEEPASPVALVNGIPIRTLDYQTLVRLRRFEIDNLIQLLELQLQNLNPQDPAQLDTYLQFQAALDNAQANREQLPATVLDDVIEAELLRQLAAGGGVAVTDEEVDAEIRRQLGFGPQPTPSPTVSPSGTVTSETTVTPSATASPTLVITPTASEIAGTATPTIEATPTIDPFETSFRQFLESLSQVGVSEEFLRKVIHQDLLRQKMRDLVTADLPTAELQVHARHILLATQIDAEEVLALLREGEDFAVLALELSLDQDTGILGGDLGWFPRGIYEAVFDEAAFALEPGEISGVVETSQGFEIIQVLEKDENRELSPEILDDRKEVALRAWLDEKRSQAAIQSLWTPEKVPAE